MDFFKFDNYANGYLSGGRALNNIRSARWVERYDELGEFEFKCPVSSNMREILPVGSFISHLDTHEVMLVENHEIDEDVEDREPEIIVTGSSAEAYMKQRAVGGDIETYVFAGERLMLNNLPYVLTFDTSWEQIRYLIWNHLNANFNIPNDNVDGFIPIANEQHTVISPETVDRQIRKQNLYSAVQELLAIDNFGIRTVRPNPDNVDPLTTEFRIHNGFDKSDSVVFSYTFGDLGKTGYLWSDKALKTDYLCVSTYYTMRSDDGPDELDRRVLYVDCTDIDGHLSDTEVTTGISGTIALLMDARGKQALRAQNSKSILRTDVSQSTRYKFRTDFNVGDIVRVNGNYDVSSLMRIAEYVEFQDERGEHGYPTLSALN
jgi:ReqiPepy6 Gp37-like protein